MKEKLGKYLYKSGIVSEEKYLAADKEAAKKTQKRALGALRKGDIPLYMELKRKLPRYLREQV
jgi:hypothetical protein